jgi:predicted AAA+ superfamily ATPase
MAFLRSLARNVATQAGLATMAADAGGADGPLKPDTARAYLASLQRLMIVEDQPAWRPHLRSKHQLRTTPTRHFVDPSLAVAALGASPDQLRGDLNMLGLLFESLVVRDLRIYAQALGGEVQHYRDHKNLEVDAVVQIADGQWAAFEIKLGQGQVDAAAESLLTFARRVDAAKMGAPVALAVVVGMGYGYLRPDGVHVIPVGGLAP